MPVNLKCTYLPRSSLTLMQIPGMRNKLRSKRLEKGYSQHDMANLMHLSQSAYQRIEHGESAWSEAQIIAAAKILECAPRDIMDDAPHMVQNYHDQSTHYQAYARIFPNRESQQRLSDCKRRIMKACCVLPLNFWP